MGASDRLILLQFLLQLVLGALTLGFGLCPAFRAMRLCPMAARRWLEGNFSSVILANCNKKLIKETHGP
jgi:hypothetical protein